MFGNWLNRIDKKTKVLICIGIGVCALLWAIWNYRKNIIFNGATRVQFLPANNKTIYLFWEDQRVHIVGNRAT
jgi:hypothetical protein